MISLYWCFLERSKKRIIVPILISIIFLQKSLLPLRSFQNIGNMQMSFLNRKLDNYLIMFQQSILLIRGTQNLYIGLFIIYQQTNLVSFGIIWKNFWKRDIFSDQSAQPVRLFYLYLRRMEASGYTQIIADLIKLLKRIDIYFLL